MLTVFLFVRHLAILLIKLNASVYWGWACRRRTVGSFIVSVRDVTSSKNGEIQIQEREGVEMRGYGFAF